MLAGLAPGTGGLDPNGNQLRTSARRVPGFDLTFKLPKSASVLYAVSDDPRVQGAIIDAGETAVREAVAWLEREAIRAKVECSTCHGDMRQQDVATRVVDMDMAFCVNCHTQKQASNDCLTCHY